MNRVRPIVVPLALMVSILAGTACGSGPPPPVKRRPAQLSTLGRPLAMVDLGEIDFRRESPRIAGPVTACIGPQLRGRQWNVRHRPFRIDLGARTAVNFERLVKAAFGDVTIDLTDQCATRAARPVIEARIVSANRVRAKIADEDTVYTAIELESKLKLPTGEEPWAHSSRIELRSAPPWSQPGMLGNSLAMLLMFTPNPHRDHAAREFGRALELALLDTYRTVLASEEIRAALAAP